MTQSKARADFIRLINPRINAAIEKIRIIGNLANPEIYEYTDNDIQIINEAISEARNECLEKFTSRGRSGRIFIADSAPEAPAAITASPKNKKNKPIIEEPFDDEADAIFGTTKGLVDADFEEVE